MPKEQAIFTMSSYSSISVLFTFDARALLSSLSSFFAIALLSAAQVGTLGGKPLFKALLQVGSKRATEVGLEKEYMPV